MKQLVSNWHFMRLMRLGLGIAIIVQSALAHETIMIATGILFTSMAVFNIGCGGVGACSTATKKNTAPATYIENKEMNQKRDC